VNHALYIGIILLIGTFGGKTARIARLPSVTGYILIGLLLGPSFLNLFTKELIGDLAFVNQIALGILSVSIGGELHRNVFKKYGKRLFIISFGDELLTLILGTGFTYLLGAPFDVAVILGILAMTVSPSGVISIINEYRTKGEFTKNVLALVAIDNLNCIVIFGIATAIIQGIYSPAIAGIGMITSVIVEIGLAVIFGVLAGIALAWMVRRNTETPKLLTILLGLVLVNTGLADQFNLSALLVNMIMGGVATNMIPRRAVLAATMERVELPIFIAFLTLAGAKLDLRIFDTVGLIVVGYVIARFVGKSLGSYLASKFTTLPVNMQRNIGLALTPQAGVAIGLSIIAEEKMPHASGMITGVVLGGVIVFEIIGPLLVKVALKNTGEIT